MQDLRPRDQYIGHVDESVSTCNGDCCVVFCLPITYEELQERKHVIQDGLTIADMVIPLTRDEARARATELRRSAAPLYDDPDANLFTCRHWDEETRLCTSYATRPDMCRRYPTYDDPNKKCDHGCQGCPLTND